MNILAIDTATEACSAALYIDSDSGENSGGKSSDASITSNYRLAPREHSRLILKMVDDLLAEANVSVSQLDAIAFGRGPGSFMGLRIAAGVVQGMAFAYDIPVIPVSTLKTIACRAFEITHNDHILVAIDARMDEVYWAAYHRSKDGGRDAWLLDDEEIVISPDKIHLPEVLQNQDVAWVGAGTGWGSYAERILSGSGFTLKDSLPDCLPSAEVMVKLAVEEFKAGNVVSAAEAIPVYLRNDVAKKPKPVVL